MSEVLEENAKRAGRWLRFFPSPQALPDPVYREFVDMLFAMRVPIAGMGLLFVAVAGLLARSWHDPLMGALAGAGVAVTVARLALIAFYRRNRPIERRALLRRWESAYAIGSYSSAALLGLLNAGVLALERPHAQLIAVSLVFSFCAGTVARVAIRPVICTVSVLVATLPTASMMMMHAALSHEALVDIQLLILEAVLIGLITALSIQTIFHLHQAAIEQHVSRHDLGRMAKRDALTGLANGLMLGEDFARKMRAARESETLVALHFVDLDGFKAVNDGHGHLAGDLVLKHVAQRLAAGIRGSDLVARVGGDEFVILQAPIAHRDEAELLAQRILQRISEAYEGPGTTLHLSASIGIAMAPECGEELATLLAAADIALYKSKAAGRRTITFAEDQAD